MNKHASISAAPVAWVVWGAFVAVGAVQAQALPTGGAIVRGSGSIGQAGNAMTVTQRSDLLVANWQSFNVGTGQVLNFVQPNAGSVAVNRVGGTAASVINGQVNANGTLMLLNPNGVAFGKNSVVNVGGLVASTHSVSVDDAYSIRRNALLPLTNAGSGSVINEGKISTNKAANSAGFILLAARNVSNAGTGVLEGTAVALRAEQNLQLGSPSVYNAPWQGYANLDYSYVVRPLRLTSQLDLSPLTSSLRVTNAGNINSTVVQLQAANNGFVMNGNTASIENTGKITFTQPRTASLNSGGMLPGPALYAFTVNNRTSRLYNSPNALVLGGTIATAPDVSSVLFKDVVRRDVTNSR